MIQQLSVILKIKSLFIFPQIKLNDCMDKTLEAAGFMCDHTRNILIIKDKTTGPPYKKASPPPSSSRHHESGVTADEAFPLVRKPSSLRRDSNSGQEHSSYSGSGYPTKRGSCNIRHSPTSVYFLSNV